MTLGPEEGLDSQRATATLVGTGLYAGFTASGLMTGAAGNTRISGLVQDNQDNPLPMVTVRVDGTTRQAQTDAQGKFQIDNAPVGPLRLVIDGSTTTVAGEWPTLPFNLVTIAGADNPLSAPVHLVKLDTANAVQVGNQDVAITLAKVPGFKLEVKAGSVTFPDGKKTGKLSVTPVNADKVPMPPPNGMQPQFIVTIQPVGARFDPPAKLTLPNVDGHKPGAQVEMYSFDHDLEEFVTIGLGTVSADGSVITSNPGVGVIKAGWHCGSQPGGSGCAHDCAVCTDCGPNCNCVPRDNDPRLANCESCENGTKKPAPTDDECCKQPSIMNDPDYISGSLQGIVACCRGSVIVCTYSEKLPKPKDLSEHNLQGDQIALDCIYKHEETHKNDHAKCFGIDCKSKATRLVSQGQAECEASRVEYQCLQSKIAQCGKDDACLKTVRFWRKQAYNYGNTEAKIDKTDGFAKCF